MELLQGILDRLDKLEKSTHIGGEILTVEEASEFTGFSKNYLYKLTHQQKIKFHKPRNKMIYFKKSELQNALYKNLTNLT